MTAKRSRQIQLVTLGTVILGGCSDADVPSDRYAYKARPECVQDWGEDNCARTSTGGGSHFFGSSGGYFYGPRFNSIVGMPDGRHIWSGNASLPAVNPRTGQHMAGAVNTSAPRSAGSSGSAASSRGGFGSTGSSFSSGS
jgi:hypothetical protein